MPPVLAAADIGSNTAHLLIGRVEDGRVVRLSDTNEWLSLGQTVRSLGFIPPEDAALLKKTLSAFRRLAHVHKAESLYVFATEAVRRAGNGRQILQSLADSGMPVDLIDGRREAELGLRGAWADCVDDGTRLMVEVGGGSAQVAFVEAHNGQRKPQILDEYSLPLGTGTLIADMGIVQPVASGVLDKLTERVRDVVAPCLGPVQGVFGVGGVARGLWRALHPDGNQVLDRREIDYLVWATSRLTDNEIAARFNVKLRRASTLLPGAVVYGTILGCLGQDRMKVSRYGVREGALLEMAAGTVESWRI